MPEIAGRWTRHGGNHRFLKSSTQPNRGWVGMVQRTSPDCVAERWEWSANSLDDGFTMLGTGVAGSLDQAFRCVEAILRVHEVGFEKREINVALVEARRRAEENFRIPELPEGHPKAEPK